MTNLSLSKWDWVAGGRDLAAKAEFEPVEADSMFAGNVIFNPKQNASDSI
jgi:hypothetical protein